MRGLGATAPGPTRPARGCRQPRPVADECQRLDAPRRNWVRNEKLHEWSRLVDDCYLLRKNLTGVDPATLWKRYIQLTEAEWAFRIAKDELAIRHVMEPEAERKTLLQRLGATLPRRLKRLDNPAPME